MLTPCTLELGGKSPAYIDSTGDLEVSDEQYKEYNQVKKHDAVEGKEAGLGEV